MKSGRIVNGMFRKKDEVMLVLVSFPVTSSCSHARRKTASVGTGLISSEIYVALSVRDRVKNTFRELGRCPRRARGLGTTPKSIPPGTQACIVVSFNEPSFRDRLEVEEGNQGKQEL